MAYHAAQLPMDIERGGQGGPNFFNTIINSPSGNEWRNQNWEYERPTWDISYGIRRTSQLEAVKIHYLGRRGTLFSFPFRDWDDYKSGPINTDAAVAIGTGDGAETDFELVKPYGDSVNPYLRRIWKPDLVYGVLAYVNGVLTAHTDVDDGIVRFAVAPANGLAITAAFRFNVPVRYGRDDLMQVLRYVNVKEMPEISLVGVRPPNY